jgi:hypothetical protein
MQRGILQRADADRDIHALFQQIDDALVAGEFELDVRLARGERRHVRHDAVEHEGRGRVDAQAPRRLLAMTRDGLFGILHRGQNGARTVKKKLSLLGQLQTARGAQNQRDAQLLFEPGERPTHAGNGLLEFFGGGGDRPRIDHGDEYEQFVGGRFHY